MSLKKLAPVTVLVLALIAGVFLFVNRGASAAATLLVDDDMAQCPTATYSTISSAVLAAAPGDTIKVCPGSYHELVTVNKSLAILGAQTGVDARAVTRTGLPATESVVDGSAGTTSFYVTANNVTIDGFTVQGATNANVFGAGIVLGAGTSGAHVVNNIVQNNIIGLILANAAGGNQALIQHNLFRNNTQPGPSSGHGIYADQFTAGGAATNVLIDENSFVVDNGASDTWGIGISNTNFANPFTNLTIQNNKMTSASPLSRGMYFYGTHSSSIKGNVITNKTNYAIGFFSGDDGITIQCNTLQNDGRGIWVADDFGNPNSNITANDDIIANNTTAGLVVETGTYTGTLNAERVWWGSPTGPTIASNPGGTGDKIIDPDGVVDYTPFDTAIPDADNDGIIDACDTQIAPTNKDQCKNGGWQNFNSPHTFKNQGDCIQYVNTGK